MRRRLLGGFLFVFLLVMSISVDAYADSPTIANPTCQRSYVSQNDYIVYPVSNRYDATLVLLDKWYAKIQITQDMYVKLSNPESGGHFYELASHFSDGYDPPSWADVSNPLGSLYWLNAWTYISWYIGEPWEDFLWSVHAEDYEIAQAKADLQTILDGGSLGPSGGGSAGGYALTSYYGEPHSFYWYSYNDKRYYFTDPISSSAPVGSEKAPATLHLNLSQSVLDAITVKENAGCKFLCRFSPDRGSRNLQIMVADSTATVSQLTNSYNQEVLRLTGKYYLLNGNYTFNPTVASANTLDLSSVEFSNWTTQNSSQLDLGLYYGAVNYSSSGGGGGDNHWPDPVIPNPPDPPDPNPEPDPDPPDPGPGIDLPDVDFPDVTIESPSTSVSFPTINIETPSPTVNPPTNTSSADYTPWLSAILSALNSIITDLDTHCQHLRQAIKTYSEALGNSINASLDSHCQHLRQAIRDYTEALASSIHDDLEYFYNDFTAYLAELAQWLVEHLNWSVDVQSPDVTVPSFDDSGIVAWLKRIYLKMGGTSHPKPDPITDTGDALDWWSALLQWIANALSGFITTFVGDVGAVVEGVLTRFPFSIPWDILAYLTLLDAERVTPVIVVTVPAVTGWWSQFSVTIDLSPYNLAMATVRSMMLVWWGFVLVMRTDWILLVMGRTGAEIASGFVSRLVGNGGD